MIKKISIFGVTYDIELVDKKRMEELWGNNKDFIFGLSFKDKCKIYILKDLAKPQQKETLYHELMHMFLDEIGYSDLSEDEKLVDLLAHAILEIVNNSRT